MNFKLRKLLIGVIASLTLFGCSEGSSASTNDSAKTYNMDLTVESESNLLLAKYDIDILLDGDKLSTIENGGKYQDKIDIKKGKHKLTFRSADDKDVKTSVDLKVKKDTTNYYLIHSDSDAIKVEKQEESDNKSAKIKMIDVTGQSLDKAKEKLENLGFDDVTYDSGDETVWDESNWNVTAQSVSAGKKVNKHDEIVLTVEHNEDSETSDESDEAEETEIPTATPAPAVDTIYDYCYKVDSPTYSTYFLFDTDGKTEMNFQDYSPNDQIKATYTGDFNSGIDFDMGGGLMVHAHWKYENHDDTLIMRDSSGNEFTGKKYPISGIKDLLKE